MKVNKANNRRMLKLIIAGISLAVLFSIVKLDGSAFLFRVALYSRR